MSLETEIKKLTIAVNDLITAIYENLPNIETVIKNPNEINSEKTPKEETPKNKFIEQVKELTKKLIAKGHERATIKKMVTDLGADTIAELDQEGLNKLFDQLSKLRSLL